MNVVSKIHFFTSIFYKMKTVKSLLILMLFSFTFSASFAQEVKIPDHNLPGGEDPEYAIQLATYRSQKALDDNLHVLRALDSGSDEHLYLSQKVGNKIKVYLVGKYGSFYPSSEMIDATRKVKSTKGFEGAFLKLVNDELSSFQPILINTVADPYGKVEELTAKGESAVEEVKEKKYKIQLGVFSDVLSTSHLAKAYGLTKWEEANIARVVSYDFTKVDEEICRRYYYGAYKNKRDARTAKRKLEKKTGRKLMMVKR